jgi:hypothetical protein
VSGPKASVKDEVGPSGKGVPCDAASLAVRLSAALSRGREVVMLESIALTAEFAEVIVDCILLARATIVGSAEVSRLDS